MPKSKLSCCGEEILKADLWILEDFKGYTKRKLFVGKCRICGDMAALQIMTKAESGETYFNLYNGIEAVKVIYREKKRKAALLPDIKTNGLYGWIYGHNIQIKNRKGEITQIRQYAADFKGNKKLVRKIMSNV